MKIAPIMKGFNETTTHILILDKKESDVLIEVFNGYCVANKRKANARKMLKQFDNELQIYSA